MVMKVAGSLYSAYSGANWRALAQFGQRLKQKLNWLPDYPLIKGISARMRGLKNGRERCGEAQFEAMIFTGTKLKGAFIVDPELKPDDRFSFPDLVQAGGVALLASK